MRVTLKKVVLENFMCYAHAEFDFYAITKIMAKNGKGKSTIATAYLWCLFNCDYELEDNPVVRREVDGVPVDDMDTSVELTLDIDGKEITRYDKTVVDYIQEPKVEKRIRRALDWTIEHFPEEKFSYMFFVGSNENKKNVKVMIFKDGEKFEAYTFVGTKQPVERVFLGG